MPFTVVEKKLNGLVLLQPGTFPDERGWFMESFKESDFEALGLPGRFAQENHSMSAKGVLRGMHFQWKPPMGKLLRVTSGEAFVAELDIRKSSPSFGRHYTTRLSSENKLMLWVPPGFANAFLALADGTEMIYRCTAEWNPAAESSIRWDDPEIGVVWPLAEIGITKPIMSEKDARAETLSQWAARPESGLFV